MLEGIADFGISAFGLFLTITRRRLEYNWGAVLMLAEPSAYIREGRTHVGFHCSTFIPLCYQTNMMRLNLYQMIVMDTWILTCYSICDPKGF